ncbi:MAG TPA: type II toxin-antitoxin system Phd/YefM family antitoxin [Gallibacterium anatis]|uniref:Type II toxin-antitoxin system Phd/YefM family antitoxin n=1 Tax=Gallibacterium anatis TaxID=750 RepID=A0A921HE04_9PAST|nr:type II toxin-antitoxin system Phd/YefM family antitoxin [Gallibacterium anatis]
MKTTNTIQNTLPNMVSSKQFQAHFGEFFDLAQTKTPVAITRYGRPTVLIMNYNEGIEAYQLLAKKRAIEILQQLAPAKDIPTQDELDKLIDNERNSL